jgi:uncharacterized protein with FMN-binding domain
VRRIVLWCLSTLSVLVLLFGYHTSTSATLATRSPTSIISGTTPGSTSSAATSTVTGSEVPTRWGPVQVQLAVAGTTITRVDVVEYPSGNPKDSEINSYALPILVQETLDQQSADIDMVSGATVTSTGYLQSLQSALDRVTT